MLIQVEVTTATVVVETGLGRQLVHGEGFQGFGIKQMQLDSVEFQADRDQASFIVKGNVGCDPDDRAEGAMRGAGINTQWPWKATQVAIIGAAMHAAALRFVEIGVGGLVNGGHGACCHTVTNTRGHGIAGFQTETRQNRGNHHDRQQDFFNSAH